MRTDISNPTRISYLLVSILGFGGAIGLVLATTFLPRLGTDWQFSLLLFIFGLVCLGPIWLRWRQGKFDLFEPPTSLSLIYFFMFGLTAIPYVTGQKDWYRVQGLLVDTEWMARTLVLLILGILALWLGYLSPIAIRIERWLGIKPSHIAPEGQSYKEIPILWILGLWVVGWIVRAYQLSQGIAGYLQAQYRDVAAAHSGSAQLLQLVSDFPLYALILGMLLLMHTKQAKLSNFIVFLGILGSEIVFNLILGFRSFVLWTFLYMAVAYYYSRKHFPKRLVVAGVLSFLFIFSLIPLYRDSINLRLFDVRDTSSVLTTLASLPGEFSQETQNQSFASPIIIGAERFFYTASRLEHMAIAVLWADRIGEFPYKNDILLLPLLTFVPRALWSGKPTRDMGAWFYTEVLGRKGITAMAVTYPGALYLSYGFWGFLIALGLTGILQRFIYRRYAYSQALSVVFMAPFLWRFLLMDSDFVGALITFIRQLIILLIIRRMVFGKSNQPTGETEFTEKQPV